MTRRHRRTAKYGPVGWEVVALITYILVLVCMSIFPRGF